MLRFKGNCMQSKILVIDDDLSYLESAKRVLRYAGREVDYFQNPFDAIAAVEKNPFTYSLALVDHLYEEDGRIERRGVETAEKLKALNPTMTVCIVSGDSSEEAVKDWLSSSVDYYRYKPIRKVETLAFVEHHINEYERNFAPVEHQDKPAHQPASIKKLNKNIVGHSSLLEECCAKALKFAKSNLNILLFGETGTGRKFFARGIHQNSQRGKLKFYSVNCESEDSESLEIKLFGSVEDAFPGAKDKEGLFEKADGATIFINKIHHLASSSLQSKLLKVLQENRVRRIGGEEDIPVDFRLITASNPSLPELCKSGQFSSGLFYKLKGLSFTIPPLRERKEDIAPSMSHFLKKYRRPYLVKSISKRTLEYLKAYNWPGNVGEIEQLVEELNLLTDDEPIITPKHLPSKIRDKGQWKKTSLNILELEKDFQQKQKAYILKALEESNNNLSHATRRLGFGNKRSTLRSRMKQLKMDSLSSYDKKGILYKFRQFFQEA